jgi:hypothetical protein
MWVRTRRKPDRKAVKKVLSEEPIPLRKVHRFAPYHEIPKTKDRRLAVVGLHDKGGVLIDKESTWMLGTPAATGQRVRECFCA